MWLIVEGRSDDMLCVLDLIGLGVDTIPDEGLDTTESMAAEVVMLAYTSGRSERPADSPSRLSSLGHKYLSFSSGYPIRWRRDESCERGGQY